MDFLAHLFNIIVLYPMINVIIYLYCLTSNFALAIILYTCIADILWIFLSLPGWFLKKKHQAIMRALEPLLEDIRNSRRDDLVRQARISALYRDAGIGRIYKLIHVWFPTFLSLSNLAFSLGVYFTFPILASSSLQTLNNLLYPFVPHLSALPNYEISLLGQTISLVRPAMTPLLVIFVALIPLLDAFRGIVIDKNAQGCLRSLGFPTVTPGTNCNLGCLFLSAAFAYPFPFIFAWLIASGVLLIMMTRSMRILITSVIISVYRHLRPG